MVPPRSQRIIIQVSPVDCAALNHLIATITCETNSGLPKEIKRIKALGGSVINDEGCFRVQGVLAVSRAIGDYYLKPYVAFTPDIYQLKRTEDDLFLVLAR